MGATAHNASSADRPKHAGGRCRADVLRQNTLQHLVLACSWRRCCGLATGGTCAGRPSTPGGRGGGAGGAAAAAAAAAAGCAGSCRPASKAQTGKHSNISMRGHQNCPRRQKTSCLRDTRKRRTTNRPNASASETFCVVSAGHLRERHEVSSRRGIGLAVVVDATNIASGTAGSRLK